MLFIISFNIMVLTLILARLISTVTTITCIILAFIQSQITFCCLNKIQRNERNVVYRRGRNHASTETIDQEYVLEKVSVIWIFN